MNETEEESFNTDKYWHIIKKSFVAKKIGSYRFYISFSHKNKIVAHRWLELEVKEFINEKT